MKKLMFLVILALMFMGLRAEEVGWKGVTRLGGAATEYGQAIAIDAAGNSYVSGYFSGSATFGSTNLTGIGSADILVLKMDASRNCLWAKQAGGAGDNKSYAIAVDAAGNSYICGYFQHTVTFGTTILTSTGEYSLFVAKIDPNGNWLRAKQAVSISYNLGYAVDVDAWGNIYISGSFFGTATFGTTSLTSNGYQDIYVAKLDPSGNWLWAKQAGGADSEAGYVIDVDAAGNSYLTGYFSGTAAFGTTSLTSSGSSDIFVAKMDANGTWIWAKRAGGTSGDCGDAIAVDVFGNCYVSGYFNGNATFGTTTLTSNGELDIFIAKLDPIGNWLWAKRAGGASSDYGKAIAVDATGNCFVSGNFSGTATFGMTSLSSYGDHDIFVAKLDNNGNWLLAKQAGSTLDDGGEGIVVDAVGNCIVSGYFSGTATFDTTSLTSTGSKDIFVAKLEPLPPVVDFMADITSGASPLQVQFTDLSTAGSGTLSSWLWSFGDGGSSTLQNPLHTYQNTGLYSVSLRVTNSYDSTSTMIKQDYITVDPGISVMQLEGSSNLNLGSTYVEEVSSYQQIVIHNTGTANLVLGNIYWSSGQHFEYYRAHPEQPILPNTEETFFVRFVPHTVGTLRDTLCVVNNSTNQPLLRIRVSGVGLYVSPQSPVNVNVTMNGYDAVLTWDAVTENTHHQPLVPDYYFVYINGSPDPDGVYYFQGMSPTNQFTHPYVAMGAEYMFYRAKAIKLYPPVRGESIDMLELKSRLQEMLKIGMTESEVSNILDHLWDERQ